MMDIDDGYILWTGIWKGKSDHLNYYSSPYRPFSLAQPLGTRKVNICIQIMKYY